MSIPEKAKPLFLLLAAPLIVFIILRLVPTLDAPAWGISGEDSAYYVWLLHYYAAVFSSFVAAIIAWFAAGALHDRRQPRRLFTTLAFATLSGYLLLSSLATPSVILPKDYEFAFRWSARIAIFGTAVYLSLANVRWSLIARKYIESHSRIIWLLNIIIGALYIIFAFSTMSLNLRTQADVIFRSLLGFAAILLFGWAAYRHWQQFQDRHIKLDLHLMIAIVLIAEAQICLMFGVWRQLSWWLFYPLLFTALIVSLTAIISAFESVKNLRPARYFFIVGSISILGLSLISGELERQLLTWGVNRWSVVGLSLLQGSLAFIILYFIVLRLDRLIHERNIALKREQRARNEVTQLIVHDLKSPLTVTMGGVKMLRKGTFGELPESQKRILGRVEQANGNILQLINDLLDVERIEAGVLQLRDVQIDIGDLLREKVAELKILADAHQQQLGLELASSLPLVLGDKELLQRLITNLVSNALKFTPDGGIIRIRATAASNTVQIAVYDNGPGIPIVDRERIFEKFGQAKGSERRGTGLGLTFCQMVAQKHSGSLIITDSPLGGACFTLSLPTRIKPIDSATEPNIIPSPIPPSQYPAST